MMTASVFDLFRIGIGSSSSHTVGPMRAAAVFVERLNGHLDRTARVRIDLYGSLALTGKGHGTDRAVLLGLEGERPESVSPHRRTPARVIRLAGRVPVAFDEAGDLVFRCHETLPRHPNGLRFTAFDDRSAVLSEEVYYSIGGGFIEGENGEADPELRTRVNLPYPFESAEALLSSARSNGMRIAEIVFENERCWRSPQEIRARALHIWNVMAASIERGLSTEGVLPGRLGVRRRAPSLHHVLRQESTDDLRLMDWLSACAIAVNEENAAGGRIVTAPTNGAAGIVPSVLNYYRKFCRGATDDGIVTFLLTAGAIGLLYKRNASISGAEVGCQGEIGVACSMAAGGLAAVLGGSNEQVECAAEIGMEHNLGLTCDPVGGLVQIPCIERNGMGAVKAVNAARMALRSNGRHHVSLDQVIRTMRDTGRDMQSKYKETSQGGLALNVIEC